MQFPGFRKTLTRLWPGSHLDIHDVESGRKVNIGHRHADVDLGFAADEMITNEEPELASCLNRLGRVDAASSNGLQ